MRTKHLDAFNQGAGVEEAKYCCSDCGFESTNRRNFRTAGEGKTCSTGHYTGPEGDLKRQKNPYARGR